MTIYYDPTESRKGTRLPDSIIKSGRPLENLERLTGSDLLVTPYENAFSLSYDMDEYAAYVVDMLLSEKTNIEIANLPANGSNV